MATEAPATTRPARTRAPRAAGTAAKASTKTTTTKATPAAAKPALAKEAATTPQADTAANVTRLKVELEFVTETKSYAKFAAPEGSGVVGSLYVPLGSERVVIMIVGPGDDGAEG